MAPSNVEWQSKAILLLVLPFTAVSVLVQARWYLQHLPAMAISTLGLSAVLGLMAWKLRTATPAAAATGAVITASLMFSSFPLPYAPWKTYLIPLLVVLILTSIATRFGRRRKERLGTAEKPRGRGAAQVAANLGMAALVMDPGVQTWFLGARWFARPAMPTSPILVLGLAALAEAAADTVSSEIGQVLGGEPRMITNLRRVARGTDGGVTLVGTLAGVMAAGAVSVAGCLALHGDISLLAISWTGGVFGLFVDSFIGATLERAGWLNNDAVNFLSTASAAAFAMAILSAVPQSGVR